MDSLIAVTLIVGTFLVGVAGNLIASELYDCAPTFARWILKRACLRLPRQARSRYREEWLSHLEECKGKMGQVLHAVGCFRATYLMQQDFLVPRKHPTSLMRRMYRTFEIWQVLVNPCPQFWLLLVRIVRKFDPFDSQLTDEEFIRRFYNISFLAKRFSNIKRLVRINRVLPAKDPSG